MDKGTVGTIRRQVHVALYDGREPDGGPPDRVVEQEMFLESDGETEITDPERIALIRAAQVEQTEGSGHAQDG